MMQIFVLNQQFVLLQFVDNFGKSTTKLGSSYLHIHPKFLHSNATSHKWVFGGETCYGRIDVGGYFAVPNWSALGTTFPKIQMPRGDAVVTKDLA
ncbi:hypothetical protein Hdeb2414_s0013g00413511 [Helianthus debilis subsp. tardiflorus]